MGHRAALASVLGPLLGACHGGAVEPPAATATSAAPAAAPLAPAGVVTVGALSVRESDTYAPPLPGLVAARSLDLAAVVAEVRRHQGELEACYGRRLAVRPALSGDVVIHGNIATTGQVTDACITRDTVGDPALVACVNQFLLARQFAVPTGGAIDVSIPLSFTPTPRVATR